MKIERRVDHTFLKLGGSIHEARTQVRRCVELDIRGFVSHPWIIKRLLIDDVSEDLKLVGVIDFPHGTASLKAKVDEVQQLYEVGCVEYDVVLNTTAVLSGDIDYFRYELAEITEYVRSIGSIVKTIVEVVLLDYQDLHKVIDIINEVKPHYFKISTGKADKYVTPDLVRTIRSMLSPRIKIKAAGGIRTPDQVVDFLDAGADIIGSSKGISIVEELKKNEY